MLDLIVAKAMAKTLDDRYQAIKELGDDLREVRRQMDHGRPATALKAIKPSSCGAWPVGPWYPPPLRLWLGPTPRVARP